MHTLRQTTAVLLPVAAIALLVAAVVAGWGLISPVPAAPGPGDEGYIRVAPLPLPGPSAAEKYELLAAVRRDLGYEPGPAIRVLTREMAAGPLGMVCICDDVCVLMYVEVDVAREYWRRLEPLRVRTVDLLHEYLHVWSAVARGQYET